MNHDCLLDVTSQPTYPYTHDPLPDWDEILRECNPAEEEVTVGIGVLAEGGDIVIIGSDLRASFPNLATANEICGKAWKLPRPFNCGVAAAGVLGECQPFVDHLWGNLKKLGNLDEIFNEQLEAAIDDARGRVIKRRADWAMQTTYCLTLDQWQRGRNRYGKLDPLLLKAGEALIRGTQLNVEAIIAGFIRGRSIFYRASVKNPIECSSTPGIYVIGKGSALAMNHLNKRGQNTGCSFARSLLHVAEALDEAQKEPTGTVGKPSQYFVAARDGASGRILPDNPTLVEWKKAYAQRDTTWSLQNSKLSEMQAKGTVWQFDSTEGAE